MLITLCHSMIIIQHTKSSFGTSKKTGTLKARRICSSDCSNDDDNNNNNIVISILLYNIKYAPGPLFQQILE